MMITIYYRLASAGRIPKRYPEKASKLHLGSTTKYLRTTAMSSPVWVKAYHAKMVNKELYTACLIFYYIIGSDYNLKNTIFFEV